MILSFWILVVILGLLLVVISIRAAMAGKRSNRAARIRVSINGTKDVPSEGLFRSVVLRWGWRIYTQRLTQAGRWFLWPTAIFMGYGTSSLELQGYIPFAYAAALWFSASVALLFSRPRAALKVYHTDRVCAGELLQVDLELKHGSGHDLTIVPHRLPEEVDSEPAEGIAVGDKIQGETTHAKLGLRCNRRGVYKLRGYRVESDYPFGLLRSQQLIEEERALIVYPPFTRLDRLDIPTGRRYQPGGIALASVIGESFEFAGNREFREGDNVRDIDWRATARLNKPIVREYREEFFMRVAVILDTHVPPEKFSIKSDWRDFATDMRAIKQRPRDTMQILKEDWKSPLFITKETLATRDDFERAVSIGAAISDYMSRQEYLVDLFAAGPNLYHLTAGRSLAYLDQILDILACVEENPEEPFERIEPELQENLAQITSVVCVFLDWNRARQDFVNRLRAHGTGLKVLIVRDSPCTVDPAIDAATLGPIRVITKAIYEAGIAEL